jgi:hypothetical protein
MRTRPYPVVANPGLIDDWDRCGARQKARFATRGLATSVRFDRHENSIDLCKSSWIVTFQHPPFLRDIVFIEDAHRSESKWCYTEQRAYCPSQNWAGVNQGLLINQVRPVYPDQARYAQIQGSMKLNAIISKTGDIVDLEALDGPIELSN